MFVQFITARVVDEAGVEASVKRAEQDTLPGAIGFLGATVGITPQREFVAVARFESAAAAKANSDRPEQTAWWNELQSSIADPVFLDCDDAEVFGAGGSDNAGFVQVITGRAKDVERAKAMDEEMGTAMQDARPDIIGGTTGWKGDRFVQTIYFTSEREAREYEAKPLEGRAKELFDEMNEIGEDIRYYDLPKPVLVTP